MHEPPLVSLGQRICRSEDTVIYYVKLVARTTIAPRPTIKTSAIRFIIAKVNAGLYPPEDPAAVSLSVCPSPLWGNLDTQPGPVPDQNGYECSPISAAVDKDPASSRSPLGT